jgi:phosphoribosylamine--glycine ligase
VRVLVVGGGAREHALVWKLHQSPQITGIFAAPGNAGISRLARTFPIAATDVEGLRRLAQEQKAELTIVGQEAALAAGIVDSFQQAKLAIFGPTRAAARIESSKLWAKELCARVGVPLPHFAAADSPAAARAKVREFGAPVVLKADGLALGKGTVVCRTLAEADAVIDDFMVKAIHGEAGARIEVEQYLEGDELSAFALVDGSQFTPLLPARDHKALLDGNRGPNTGGMGGYSRPPYATPALMEEINHRVFAPVVRGLAETGAPFIGVLYAGLFITREGPRVIEFNARWGDPEAQLLLPLLDTDLAELSLACIEGRLDEVPVDWRPGVTVGVGVAAAGYPDTPRKGDAISGLDDVDDDVLVFHAATRFADGNDDLFLTDGGRILTVVAEGDTLAAARQRAYANVERIHFEGMQYRGDLAGVGPAAATIPEVAQNRPAGGEFVVTQSERTTRPRVAILMGSESDRELMNETAKVLESLGIEQEMHVMSAHRTPTQVTKFAREAERNGVKVIVAGAGLAAALPGVLAANTTLPVIGVPIAGGTLLGLDSLLSIVQMPPGVPVATVAIGTPGARNAGYLAAAMIALADDEVRARWREFREKQSGEPFE